MPGLRRRTLSRHTGTVGVLAAGLVLVACTPAVASNVRISHALFGAHDGTPGNASFGTIHEGAVRLWDVGVRWDQIETHAGGVKYHWAALDARVRAAQAAHAEVTMVVAGTPRFYASDPTRPPGRLSHYTDFVRALMKRYKSFEGSRGISAYQVWNEANIRTFWSGTIHQMAVLSQKAYQVRNRVDPHAKVIAPPMVTLQPYQFTWMKKFYAQRVDGKRVSSFFDAVGLTLYPHAKKNLSTGTPEDSMKALALSRRILRQDGVSRSKPIWSTEINYGLQIGDLAGHPAFKISSARQAAFVIRTYLLNAAHGVKRVFWYRYDWGPMQGGGTIGNTLLTDPSDSSRVTAAGHAYLRVQHWMHGTLVGPRHGAPCPTDRNGTYTCVVKDSSGTRRIYWNPSRSARVKLAANAHHLTGTLGGVTKVRPGSTIKVGERPVMAGR